MKLPLLSMEEATELSMPIYSKPPSSTKEKSHTVRKSASQLFFSTMRLNIYAARQNMSPRLALCFPVGARDIVLRQ